MARSERDERRTGEGEVLWRPARSVRLTRSVRIWRGATRDDREALRLWTVIPGRGAIVRKTVLLVEAVSC